jgi:YidC/Oxa1 family membrane protein insertase
MEKRLLLAIVLSLLVLLTWSAVTPKPQPIARQEVATKVEKPDEPSPVLLSQAGPVENAAPEKIIKFEQGSLEVFFNEPLAAIKEVRFKKYNNYSLFLGQGFYLKNLAGDFVKDQVTSDSISFKAVLGGRTIVKRFKFRNSGYYMELETKITNTPPSIAPVNYSLVLGLLDTSSKNPQARFLDIIFASQEKTVHLSAQKKAEQDKIKFIGFRDQYFGAIAEPSKLNAVGYISKDTGQLSEVGLNVQSESILSKDQTGHLFKAYIGPQDINLLSSINPEWPSIIHFGTFDFISQILIQGLNFLYKLVNNWGVAIILLSVLVYLLLYPLSSKQMRSMKEMQLLQPKVEELRKAFKDNPQKMNKEIMELYREHKVNPLGGCLPLLLQMPIFFALYNALMRSIVLKGATFLWIKDLSEPDRLLSLPKGLPVIGGELNILPIIMAIGMFLQQKISLANTRGEAAEQQKIMLIVMPVMFGLIFYRMPSGLVLYWFVNSALMLIFQLRLIW